MFSRIKIKIHKWLDMKAIERFERIMPKDIITKLYRMVAERDLLITTKEVAVKKGKVKYTLFIVQDKGLKTVFNLGRHHA